MNSFKQILRRLRKESNLTQGQLGEKLDYGYTAISNYESGRNEPSINDLIKLSRIFNVSIDYLVGNSKFFIKKTKIFINGKITFGEIKLTASIVPRVVKFKIRRIHE